MAAGSNRRLIVDPANSCSYNYNSSLIKLHVLHKQEWKNVCDQNEIEWFGSW